MHSFEPGAPRQPGSTADGCRSAKEDAMRGAPNLLTSGRLRGGEASEAIRPLRISGCATLQNRHVVLPHARC